MNGRRWSVLSSKGQLSTARLLPRASICVWSAVWVGFSAESAMANLEPNRSGSANNVSMTSSWHTYSSSHNFVRPPSPAPILTGQAKGTFSWVSAYGDFTHHLSLLGSADFCWFIRTRHNEVFPRRVLEFGQNSSSPHIVPRER